METSEFLRSHEDQSKIAKDDKIIARGGSKSLLGLTLGKVLTFLTEIILARFLGVANYGLLSLGRTIIQTPSFAADIGMRHAIVRHSPTYWIKDQKDYQKGLLLGSIQVTIGVSLLVSLSIYLKAAWIAEWFNEPGLERILKVLSWMLLPSALSMVIASYARAHLKFGVDVILRILVRQLLIFFLSLIIIGWLKGGALDAAYVLLLAASLNAALAVLVVVQNLYPSLKFTVAKYRLKEWIRFSIPTFLVDVTYLMLKNTGRILLGYFGQVEAVGIFTVASTLGENLIFFLIAFNPILAPIIVAYHTTGDKVELTRNYRTVGRWQLFLTLPFAVVMIIYPREIMLLFGADFQAADIVLILIVLAQCAYVATGPSSIVLQMTGHHDIELINGIIAFAINLIAGIVLIPNYGLVGASISTALALIVLQICRLIEVYVLVKVFPYDRSFLKGLLAGIISYICGSAIKELIVFNSSLSTLVLGAIVVAATFISSLALLKFEDSDAEIMRGLMVKGKIGIKRVFSRLDYSHLG